MTDRLRDKLIGAWKLVSFVEQPLNGSAPNYPMGETPLGIIMYTPDGYMSAQLMRPNPGHFASPDWFKATPEEYTRAASNYFAYAGPFEVDEESKTVTHFVLVSLFPNWIGQKQQRIARIEGDALHLSTASPIQSGGRPVNAYLEWRRAHTLNMGAQDEGPVVQGSHVQ
jgi:hypothetical protein